MPLVELLLAHGARPDSANAYGSSPLGEAINAANVELTARLLEAGADVESTNLDGQTALMLAARVGSAEIAQLLVDSGADVNALEAWRNQTALMWAADAAAGDVAALLIEAGADVTVRAAVNEWSAQITSEPRAQYRPTGGLTALLYAARSGCTACIDPILEAGADIDRPNPDGVTPLLIALDNFRFETAKLLLERGANPHVWDWWGRTALYVTADVSRYNRRRSDPVPQTSVSGLEIAEMLLDAGVDPNTQLNMHRPGRGGNSGRFVDDLLTTGATPLLRAAMSHDAPLVDLLLRRGAQVDLPNVMGVTPLMSAAGMGVSPRDRRIDISSDVQQRVIETLELLLAAGADINASVVTEFNKSARIARPSSMTEREGQTALFGAIKWAWTDVVEYLLDRGADPAAADARGLTPLDAALGRTGGRDNRVSEEIAALLRAQLGAGE
jgi:ankyrin repeat protein